MHLPPSFGSPLAPAPSQRWLDWSALGIALLAGLAAFWSAQSLYDSQRKHTTELAARRSQSVARETATLLGEMRNGITFFSQQNAQLLEQLAVHPDAHGSAQALAAALALAFPSFNAFTLVRPDGQLVVDDLGEALGDLCLRDIEHFRSSHQDNVSIHPGPRTYHFDLMVPWPTPQGEGTFFVSFKTDRLARLLGDAQLPEHRLLLINRRVPGLIEVTPQGARDVLNGDHFLPVSTMNELRDMGALTEVPGTSWWVADVPAQAIWERLAYERRARLGSSLSAILGVLLAAWWMARSALKRQAADAAEHRLIAAVFNSAQEGIAITDLEGRYLAVNQAFVGITDFSEAEALGQTPKLLNSGRHEPAFYQNMWQALRDTGQWQGEIWNRRKGGEVHLEWLSISTVYTAEGEPENYVAVYTDFSRIRHAKTELEHLAHHDALTNLPNRLLLFSRLDHALERARRNGTQLAVLYLDLDGFKTVNDTLGHHVGDGVLQKVALLLSTRLRGADTVARLGGDEFVVLLEEVPDGAELDHALSVARTIASLLTQPMEVHPGTTVVVGASIGISRFPLHGQDAASLLSQADTAMYHAKQHKTGIAVATAQSAT